MSDTADFGINKQEKTQILDAVRRVALAVKRRASDRENVWGEKDQEHRINSDLYSIQDFLGDIDVHELVVPPADLIGASELAPEHPPKIRF